MKQSFAFSFSFIFFAFASFLIVGCNKEIAQKSEASLQQETEVFTLTATYGSTDTKVAFDDDGLGLSWVPGDCLYLVDVTGKNSTVKMTTDITQTSKSAPFRSTSSVLSGDYIVLSGANALSMSPYSELSTSNTLQNHIILYGTLSVSDGQTSASITLTHAFAKLKFTFKNYPSSLSSTSFGMAVSSDGIPYTGSFSSTGFTPNDSGWRTIVSFGGNSIDNGMSALVAPCDYSGSKVLFYCYGTSTNGSHVTYEIQKQGIELKAGTNYNIEFDFSKATVSTITGNSLNTAADFRAAAYWNNSSNTYTIDSDIDFSNEVYIPVNCRYINGKNHVLSNININFSKCDNIGLIGKGYASSVALINTSVLGRNNVGAIAGVFYDSTNSTSTVSKIIVKGTSKITGNNYVGGLFGQLNEHLNINTCAFEGDVTGGNYVGGIFGCSGSFGYSLTRSIKSVYSKGDVEGNNYVGGISGYLYCRGIYSSYHIGKVSGTGTDVGGIIGKKDDYSNINYCYSNGTVSNSCGVSYSYAGYKCITSCTKLSISNTSSEYCNFNSTKTFLSGLSIINVEEAYSTQVWPNIAEQCPLLQWQSDALNGDITIPGYGDVNW